MCSTLPNQAVITVWWLLPLSGQTSGLSTLFWTFQQTELIYAILQSISSPVCGFPFNSADKKKYDFLCFIPEEELLSSPFVPKLRWNYAVYSTAGCSRMGIQPQGQLTAKAECECPRTIAMSQGPEKCVVHRWWHQSRFCCQAYQLCLESLPSVLEAHVVLTRINIWISNSGHVQLSDLKH